MPELQGIPDYFNVISHPMDLGSVRSRLDSGYYQEWRDFMSDVKLVFSNATTYNSNPDEPVHIAAVKLKNVR
jgi:hypothetical protein